MCRLLAVLPAQAQDPRSLLSSFGKLAACGCVPPGAPGGHKDGWGLVGFFPTQEPQIVKEATDASADRRYQAAVEVLCARQPSLLIGHLRKASTGAIERRNTHPFLRKGVALCHNGTVHSPLPLSQASEEELEGESDSERLLAMILERQADGLPLEQAVSSLVIHLRRTAEYTALNLLISDGTTLVAVRETGAAAPEELTDAYYTLFTANRPDGQLVAICSERIAANDLAYTAIPNHSTLTLSLVGQPSACLRRLPNGQETTDPGLVGA